MLVDIDDDDDNLLDPGSPFIIRSIDTYNSGITTNNITNNMMTLLTLTTIPPPSTRCQRTCLKQVWKHALKATAYYDYTPQYVISNHRLCVNGTHLSTFILETIPSS